MRKSWTFCNGNKKKGGAGGLPLFLKLRKIRPCVSSKSLEEQPRRFPKAESRKAQEPPLRDRHLSSAPGTIEVVGIAIPAGRYLSRSLGNTSTVNRHLRPIYRLTSWQFHCRGLYPCK